MDAQTTNLLHTIELFSALPPEQTNAIGDLCEWIRVEKGATIIDQKTKSTDVYFIAEGRVAAKGYSHEGKEVTYAEIGAGQVFGEFSAIDQQQRSSAIEAVEDAYLAKLSSNAFRQILLDYPLLGLRLCELLVAKNRSLTNRMFEYSTMAVSQRICAELLRMMHASDNDQSPGLIQPSPSHYEIATRLSTHREAVSKEIASLTRKGILESGRKFIHILDPARLRELTSYDFGGE